MLFLQTLTGHFISTFHFSDRKSNRKNNKHSQEKISETSRYSNASMTNSERESTHSSSLTVLKVDSFSPTRWKQVSRPFSLPVYLSRQSIHRYFSSLMRLLSKIASPSERYIHLASFLPLLLSCPNSFCSSFHWFKGGRGEKRRYFFYYSCYLSEHSCRKGWRQRRPWERGTWLNAFSKGLIPFWRGKTAMC